MLGPRASISFIFKIFLVLRYNFLEFLIDFLILIRLRLQYAPAVVYPQITPKRFYDHKKLYWTSKKFWTSKQFFGRPKIRASCYVLIELCWKVGGLKVDTNKDGSFGPAKSTAAAWIFEVLFEREIGHV